MGSLARKWKRIQDKKERDEFKRQLVKEGKKLVFDLKENKIKIVEVQKPYRKEKEKEEVYE